jgi:hypothetical protein
MLYSLCYLPCQFYHHLLDHPNEICSRMQAVPDYSGRAVAVLRWADPPSKEFYPLCIGLRNRKSGQGPKGCRVIETEREGTSCDVLRYAVLSSFMLLSRYQAGSKCKGRLRSSWHREQAHGWAARNSSDTCFKLRTS